MLLIKLILHNSKKVYKPIKYKKSKGNFDGNTLGVQGLRGSQGCAGHSGTAGNNTYSTLGNFNGIGMLSSTTNVATSVYLSSDLSFSQDYWIPSTTSTSALNINTLETGRVEKGEMSNQTLKSVNSEFAETAFHTVTYKIMPISAMNRTIGEVREYCTGCGYRIRKNNWTFCPKCGSKLQ